MNDQSTSRRTSSSSAPTRLYIEPHEAGSDPLHSLDGIGERPPHRHPERRGPTSHGTSSAGFNSRTSQDEQGRAIRQALPNLEGLAVRLEGAGVLEPTGGGVGRAYRGAGRGGAGAAVLVRVGVTLLAAPGRGEERHELGDLLSGTVFLARAARLTMGAAAALPGTASACSGGGAVASAVTTRLLCVSSPSGAPRHAWLLGMQAFVECPNDWA